jgi:DNA-directed RNA polymerase subunit E'/Rpb7
MDIFFETVVDDIVKVSPSKCNKSYKKHIKDILVSKYEGVCSKFGYINKKSIEIITVHLGIVELQTFHGYVRFNVKFKALVCNPAVGSVVKCRVQNLNSFGILSHVVTTDTNENIMNIIVPKQSLSIVNNESVNNIASGDDIFVEIVGKKYQLNSTTISGIGKVIDHADYRIKMDDYSSKILMGDDEESELLSETYGDDTEDEHSVKSESGDKSENEVENQSDDESVSDNHQSDDDVSVTGSE